MKKQLIFLAGIALALCAIGAQAAGVPVLHYLSTPDMQLGLAGAAMAGITTYVQDGDVLDLTPATDVASGVGYLFGAALFGVAGKDVAANTPGPFITKGVLDIAKTGALAISVGDRLYWDATNKCVNKTATAQQQVGVCVAAALAADTKVRIKLGAALATAA